MIIKLEEKVPSRIPTFEETSSTLIERGLIKQFIESSVELEMREELRKSTGLVIDEEAVPTSRLQEGENPLLAWAGDWKLYASDVLTSGFLSSQPDNEWEKKEVIALINRRATVRALEKEAKALVAESPVYPVALSLVEEWPLAQQYFKVAKVDGSEPVLKNCPGTIDECRDSILENRNFVLLTD